MQHKQNLQQVKIQIVLNQRFTNIKKQNRKVKIPANKWSHDIN